MKFVVERRGHATGWIPTRRNRLRLFSKARFSKASPAPRRFVSQELIFLSGGGWFHHYFLPVSFYHGTKLTYGKQVSGIDLGGFYCAA